MKNFHKLTFVIPICFSVMIFGGQNVYSAGISTFDQLKNIDSYDTNTQITDDIDFDSQQVIRFQGKTINIFGNDHIIDGGEFGYYSPDFQPSTDGGTGFGFFSGTSVGINHLTLNNFTHRERGTVYINNSSAILDYITMNGFQQEIKDGHIWGSMVAVVDSSQDVVIQNSTFQNVDLTLKVSESGKPYDVDGGVLHV